MICWNRRITAWNALYFDDVLEIYNSGRSDESRLGVFEALPNVTIVYISATRPTEFLVVKYAEISKAACGVEKKGKRLRGFKGKTYRDVLMQHCLRAKYIGHILFHDVLWEKYGTCEESFF